MENRFGIKDGVIIVLLIVCIVLIALSMKQFDRQWNEIKVMKSKQDETISAQVSQEKALLKMQKNVDRQMRAMAAVLSQKKLVDSGEGTDTTNIFNDPDAKDYLGTPWVGLDMDYFNRIEKAEELPNYSTGDYYVRSFAGKVGLITPYLSSDNYASIVQSYILESLADRDAETLEWKPVLAEKWQISEDGLEFVFKMREGVKFSDGQPVTVDDVVFTYDLVMNPKFNAPHSRSYYSTIQSVEKLDDMHVKFTFKDPYFRAFELAAGMSILPKHFYGKMTPIELNSQKGMLMGSGPYRLETPDGWQPGQPVILYRNQRYWGPTAPFDEIRFKIILNANSRLVEFRNQEIDSFGANPKQWVKLIVDDQINGISNHYQFLSRSAGYRYIGWNQKTPDGKKASLFADRRVREAMTYLTPRQKIVDDVLLGLARVSMGPFHPRSQQNSPNVLARPYDPDKAMALLKEAGFSYDNERKVMLTPEGKPFEFELMYPSGSPVYDEIMTMIKSSYAKAGINMKKNPIEWSVFLKDLDARKFEAVSLGWTGGVETDINQMFHSEQMEGKGHNFIHYNSPELDALIKEARATVDEKKRMEIWKKAHEVLHRDQPYTFLSVGDSLSFITKRFQNIQQLEMGLNPDTEWFVPKIDQKWTRD